MKDTHWSSRLGFRHDANNLTLENNVLRNLTMNVRWIVQEDN
jgi:hypothetical protein